MTGACLVTTVAVPIRLARDRPTWLVYFQLAVFATYIYGLSAALPLLRLEQHTSNTVAGLHGTAMAAGTILAGLSLPLFIRTYGTRATTWIGMTGINVGLALVLVTSALPFTLLGFGVSGLFGSVMLYAAMAALADHHGQAGPAAINEANAIGVTAGIAATFLLSALAQTALGWRAAMLLTPVASVALAVAMGRVWIPAAEERHEVREAPARTALSWRFHLAGGVLFCCVAVEFCFNLWAAELFSVRTGLSAAAAATGLTAFIVGIALGRFAGTPLALRFRPATLLVGALALAAGGWLLFWLSTHPVLSYAGLVISGLGVSLHFPLALAGMIAQAGSHPDRAASAAPIWAGLAMGAGPFVLGALADGFSTHTAFLLVPVLVGFAVGGVLISRWRA